MPPMAPIRTESIRVWRFGAKAMMKLQAAWRVKARRRVFFLPRRSATAPVGISVRKKVRTRTVSMRPMPA